jgi:hypothetical protein
MRSDPMTILKAFLLVYAVSLATIAAFIFGAWARSRLASPADEPATRVTPVRPEAEVRRRPAA